MPVSQTMVGRGAAYAVQNLGPSEIEKLRLMQEGVKKPDRELMALREDVLREVDRISKTSNLTTPQVYDTVRSMAMVEAKEHNDHNIPLEAYEDRIVKEMPGVVVKVADLADKTHLHPGGTYALMKQMTANMSQTLTANTVPEMFQELEGFKPSREIPAPSYLFKTAKGVGEVVDLALTVKDPGLKPAAIVQKDAHPIMPELVRMAQESGLEVREIPGILDREGKPLTYDLVVAKPENIDELTRAQLALRDPEQSQESIEHNLRTKYRYLGYPEEAVDYLVDRRRRGGLSEADKDIQRLPGYTPDMGGRAGIGDNHYTNEDIQRLPGYTHERGSGMDKKTDPFETADPKAGIQRLEGYMQETLDDPAKRGGYDGKKHQEVIDELQQRPDILQDALSKGRGADDAINKLLERPDLLEDASEMIGGHALSPKRMVEELENRPDVVEEMMRQTGESSKEASNPKHIAPVTEEGPLGTRALLSEKDATTLRPLRGKILDEIFRPGRTREEYMALRRYGAKLTENAGGDGYALIRGRTLERLSLVEGAARGMDLEEFGLGAASAEMAKKMFESDVSDRRLSDHYKGMAKKALENISKNTVVAPFATPATPAGSSYTGEAASSAVAGSREVAAGTALAGDNGADLGRGFRQFPEACRTKLDGLRPGRSIFPGFRASGWGEGGDRLFFTSSGEALREIERAHDKGFGFKTYDRKYEPPWPKLRTFTTAYGNRIELIDDEPSFRTFILDKFPRARRFKTLDGKLVNLYESEDRGIKEYDKAVDERRGNATPVLFPRMASRFNSKPAQTGAGEPLVESAPQPDKEQLTLDYTKKEIIGQAKRLGSALVGGRSISVEDIGFLVDHSDYAGESGGLDCARTLIKAASGKGESSELAKSELVRLIGDENPQFAANIAKAIGEGTSANDAFSRDFLEQNSDILLKNLDRSICGSSKPFTMGGLEFEPPTFEASQGLLELAKANPEKLGQKASDIFSSVLASTEDKGIRDGIINALADGHEKGNMQATQYIREKIIKPSGLDADKLLDTWWRNVDRSIENTEQARINRVKQFHDNISTLAQLCEKAPEAAKYLYERYGIQNHGRYTAGTLLTQYYQDMHLKGLEGQLKALRVENKPTAEIEAVLESAKPKRSGIIVNPETDWNGAFHTDVLKGFYEDLVVNEGFRINEANDKISLTHRLGSHASEFGKAEYVILSGHGQPGSIQLGEGKNSHIFETDIMGERADAVIRGFIRENATVIANSCSTSAFLAHDLPPELQPSLHERLTYEFTGKGISPAHPLRYTNTPTPTSMGKTITTRYGQARFIGPAKDGGIAEASYERTTAGGLEFNIIQITPQYEYVTTEWGKGKVIKPPTQPVFQKPDETPTTTAPSIGDMRPSTTADLIIQDYLATYMERPGRQVNAEEQQLRLEIADRKIEQRMKDANLTSNLNGLNSDVPETAEKARQYLADGLNEAFELTGEGALSAKDLMHARFDPSTGAVYFRDWNPRAEMIKASEGPGTEGERSQAVRDIISRWRRNEEYAQVKEKLGMGRSNTDEIYTPTRGFNIRKGSMPGRFGESGLSVVFDYDRVTAMHERRHDKDILSGHRQAANRLLTEVLANIENVKGGGETWGDVALKLESESYIRQFSGYSSDEHLIKGMVDSTVRNSENLMKHLVEKEGLTDKQAFVRLRRLLESSLTVDQYSRRANEVLGGERSYQAVRENWAESQGRIRGGYPWDDFKEPAPPTDVDANARHAAGVGDAAVGGSRETVSPEGAPKRMPSVNAEAEPSGGFELKFQNPPGHMEAKLASLRRDLGIGLFDLPDTRRGKLERDLNRHPTRLKAIPNGTLMDGNTRYYYAKKLGIPDERIPVYIYTAQDVRSLAQWKKEFSPSGEYEGGFTEVVNGKPVFGIGSAWNINRALDHGGITEELRAKHQYDELRQLEKRVEDVIRASKTRELASLREGKSPAEAKKDAIAAENEAIGEDRLMRRAMESVWEKTQRGLTRGLRPLANDVTPMRAPSAAEIDPARAIRYDAETVSGVDSLIRRHERRIDKTATIAVDFERLNLPQGCQLTDAGLYCDATIRRGVVEQLAQLLRSQERDEAYVNRFRDAAMSAENLSLVNRNPRNKGVSSRYIISHEDNHGIVDAMSRADKEAIWELMSPEERKRATEHITKKWKIDPRNERAIMDEYFTEALTNAGKHGSPDGIKAPPEIPELLKECESDQQQASKIREMALEARTQIAKRYIEDLGAEGPKRDAAIKELARLGQHQYDTIGEGLGRGPYREIMAAQNSSDPKVREAALEITDRMNNPEKYIEAEPAADQVLESAKRILGPGVPATPDLIIYENRIREMYEGLYGRKAVIKQTGGHRNTMFGKTGIGWCDSQDEKGHVAKGTADACERAIAEATGADKAEVKAFMRGSKDDYREEFIKKYRNSPKVVEHQKTPMRMPTVSEQPTESQPKEGPSTPEARRSIEKPAETTLTRPHDLSEPKVAAAESERETTPKTMGDDASTVVETPEHASKPVRSRPKISEAAANGLKRAGNAALSAQGISAELSLLHIYTRGSMNPEAMHAIGPSVPFVGSMGYVQTQDVGRVGAFAIDVGSTYTDLRMFQAADWIASKSLGHGLEKAGELTGRKLLQTSGGYVSKHMLGNIAGPLFALHGGYSAWDKDVMINGSDSDVRKAEIEAMAGGALVTMGLGAWATGGAKMGSWAGVPGMVIGAEVGALCGEVGMLAKAGVVMNQLHAEGIERVDEVGVKNTILGTRYGLVMPKGKENEMTPEAERYIHKVAVRHTTNGLRSAGMLAPGRELSWEQISQLKEAAQRGDNNEAERILGLRGGFDWSRSEEAVTGRVTAETGHFPKKRMEIVSGLCTESQTIAADLENRYRRAILQTTTPGTRTVTRAYGDVYAGGSYDVKVPDPEKAHKTSDSYMKSLEKNLTEYESAHKKAEALMHAKHEAERKQQTDPALREKLAQEHKKKEDALMAKNAEAEYKYLRENMPEIADLIRNPDESSHTIGMNLLFSRAPGIHDSRAIQEGRKAFTDSIRQFENGVMSGLTEPKDRQQWAQQMQGNPISPQERERLIRESTKKQLSASVTSHLPAPEEKAEAARLIGKIDKPTESDPLNGLTEDEKKKFNTLRTKAEENFENSIAENLTTDRSKRAWETYRHGGEIPAEDLNRCLLEAASRKRLIDDCGAYLSSDETAELRECIGNAPNSPASNQRMQELIATAANNQLNRVVEQNLTDEDHRKEWHEYSEGKRDLSPEKMQELIDEAERNKQKSIAE
ncbi:MAG: hypothetical protein V1875_08985 [Candidatus Altiarchaeota archaeon]